MHSVSTKFEINLQSSNAAEIGSSSTFVVHNHIPAIVVSPSIFLPAMIDREAKVQRYKLIVAVDFENNGKNYAMAKIQHLPKEILDADGFDIMVTPNRNEIETNKEMVALHDFLKQINPLTEIRWVLGCRRQTTESISTILRVAKKNPASFVRNDNNVVLPKIEIGHHKVDASLIRKHVGTAIKLSGNINLATIKATQDQVARFDVSVAQARAIIREAEIEATKTFAQQT